MEPQAECWVKWEVDLSPVGAAQVLTQTLKSSVGMTKGKEA